MRSKNCLALALALLLTGAVRAQETLNLTLDKALEIALADNPTIKVADQEIQLKKVANKEAWQNLLPELSVSGSWQHTIKAPEMKLNGMSFRMGDDGVNTAAAVATLSLPVFAPAVTHRQRKHRAAARSPACAGSFFPASRAGPARSRCRWKYCIPPGRRSKPACPWWMQP